MDVVERLVDRAPREVARELVEHATQEWLAQLQVSLERERAVPDLDRILAAWGLSQSAAAELFGVSRQAFGKWRQRGVPSGQLETVADLAAATDLLVRHLKPDRIPAVVRRRSDRLGGRSLVTLVREGRSREVLGACREMFRFGDALD